MDTPLIDGLVSDFILGFPIKKLEQFVFTLLCLEVDVIIFLIGFVICGEALEETKL